MSNNDYCNDYCNDYYNDYYNDYRHEFIIDKINTNIYNNLKGRKKLKKTIRNIERQHKYIKYTNTRLRKQKRKLDKMIRQKSAYIKYCDSYLNLICSTPLKRVGGAPNKKNIMIPEISIDSNEDDLLYQIRYIYFKHNFCVLNKKCLCDQENNLKNTINLNNNIPYNNTKINKDNHINVLWIFINDIFINVVCNHLNVKNIIKMRLINKLFNKIIDNYGGNIFTIYCLGHGSNWFNKYICNYVKLFKLFKLSKFDLVAELTFRYRNASPLYLKKANKLYFSNLNNFCIKIKRQSKLMNELLYIHTTDIFNKFLSTFYSIQTLTLYDIIFKNKQQFIDCINCINLISVKNLLLDKIKFSTMPNKLIFECPTKLEVLIFHARYSIIINKLPNNLMKLLIICDTFDTSIVKFDCDFPSKLKYLFLSADILEINCLHFTENEYNISKIYDYLNNTLNINTLFFIIKNSIHIHSWYTDCILVSIINEHNNKKLIKLNDIIKKECNIIYENDRLMAIKSPNKPTIAFFLKHIKILIELSGSLKTYELLDLMYNIFN